MQGASAETPARTCQRGPAHAGQPIMMVCLEKDCTRKRLCCLTCIDDIHCKHEVISLKKYEKYIYDTLNYNSMCQNRDKMVGLIGQGRSAVTLKIEDLKKSVVAKIDRILEKINSHYNFIEETFVSEKYVNVYQELKTQLTDEKIEQFFGLACKAESNLVGTSDEIVKAIQLTSQNVDEKIVTLNKQMDKSTEQITKVIEQFKITGKAKITEVFFNPETKAACLVLQQNNKLVKRGEGSGGYPIVLLNYPFSQSNNQYSFMIKQEPGNKGIWMGACVLDIVKNFNFQSCYGIGKGTWAIDQVSMNHASAYTWSHHDSNFNSQPKVGWQFAVDDVVSISINYEKSTVVFTKNGEETYEQPVRLDLGDLYAFVGPTNLNDEIVIVQ